MSARVVYRKVQFIDPQPKPDGTGPSVTTFDLALPSMKDWSFSREGEMVTMRDNAGHEMEVPYVRVLRAFRLA